MAERTRDPDFAWYRLQRREMAALLAIALLVAALASWAWFRDSRAFDPPVEPREMPPALIHVNSASAAELAALPGIGEAKAARIVEFRKSAPITSIAELADAAGGIPAKSQERMAPYVAFDSE